MKFIKTIWTKLDLRLTLIVLLMSLLPLLILGQFALTNSRRVLEEQKFDHLNGLNLLKADEIVQWENNHIRQIRALAQRPLVT